MCATMSGCSAHHWVRADVHSRARRTSNTLWQNAIVLQYTSPVTIGDTSPAHTATMHSSSSEPRLDASLPDERVTLLLHDEGDEVGVAEAPADLGRLAAGRVGGGGVAAGDLLQQHGDQQVAALDAVAPFALQHPTRATEPAGRVARLAAQQEAEPDPERAARGPPRLVGVEMPPVRLLQAPEELVAAPEHVGSGRERLEVGRVQGRGPLRARQRVVRVAPASVAESSRPRSSAARRATTP